MKKILSALLAGTMLAFVLLPAAKVQAAATVTLAATTLPHATVGSSYYAAVPFTNSGNGYTTYALNGIWTGLPNGIIGQGLSSDPNHVYGMLGSSGNFTLSGTPTTPGTYNVNLSIDDQYGATASQNFVLIVDSIPNVGTPSITTNSLPDATIGQAYSTQIQATGGTPPYNWSVISTTYPSACCVLGLNGSTGVFNTQSSPTVINTYSPGTYSWVIQITDANGKTSTKTLNLNIKAASASSNTLIPSDTFVSFNVAQGSPNPPNYNLHITNASSVSINYNLSVPNQPAWLNCGYSTQTLPLDAGGVAGVCVAVDASKVSGPGTYTANLTVTGNFSNSPIVIPVTLTVAAASSPAPTPTPTSGGVNLPDGTVLKLPGSPTVYLVSGGQLVPFTSANDFLSKGYSWSQVQEVSPSQVNNSTGNGSFYPYPSGSIINDNGTIYFINGSSKIPFTNYEAFIGLGYSLKNVLPGDLTNYTLATNYFITTANAAHPWGSWLIYNGTVYYSTQNGLIGVPSSAVFISNGGSWNLLVKANTYDIAVLNANSPLPPLVANDSRIYSAK